MISCVIFDAAFESSCLFFWTINSWIHFYYALFTFYVNVSAMTTHVCTSKSLVNSSTDYSYKSFISCFIFNSIIDGLSFITKRTQLLHEALIIHFPIPLNLWYGQDVYVILFRSTKFMNPLIVQTIHVSSNFLHFCHQRLFISNGSYFLFKRMLV